MYESYATYKGWSFQPVRVDIEEIQLTEMMRKAVFEVEGTDVFKHFKFESGNRNYAHEIIIFLTLI